MSVNGTLKYKNMLCVPDDEKIKKEILTKAHTTLYSLHLCTTKIYNDLKMHYWWPGMKKDLVEFVAKCLTCKHIKAEHQRPYGLLQPLQIPEWKWKILLWILWLGYRRLLSNMMLFGLLSIGTKNRHIFFLYVCVTLWID